MSVCFRLEELSDVLSSLTSHKWGENVFKSEARGLNFGDLVGVAAIALSIMASCSSAPIL